MQAGGDPDQSRCVRTVLSFTPKRVPGSSSVCTDCSRTVAHALGAARGPWAPGGWLGAGEVRDCLFMLWLVKSEC